jgi:hypothetical protein
MIAILSLILGSWKGYVALFEKGAEEPRQVFPYRTESLPPVDQQALEKGIPVLNEKVLQHLLEDFTS